MAIKYLSAFFITGFLLVNMFLSGCSGEKAACQSETNKTLLISWGEYYSESGIMSGYRLTSEAAMYSFKDSLGNAKNIEKIMEIDPEVYCGIVNRLENMFAKVHVLNSPGDTSRFIEYKNPATVTTLRAVWNPKHDTYLSKGFRAFYDTLQHLHNKPLEK